LSSSVLQVPDGLTLLVGGARSGKSALAVRLGEGFNGPVTFLATATPGDQDMAARIERHRTERPPTWATIESPLLDATTPSDGLLIIDCITLWVANVMFAAPGNDEPEYLDSELSARTTALLTSWSQRTGPTIVVTNEVGLGIVPEHSISRTYRDAIGRVNSRIAASADRAMFLAAGRILPLLHPHEVFS
jgi:adenosylcobinamide kinase / adenosylcobinamide-phosphate guanylyltransferase